MASNVTRDHHTFTRDTVKNVSGALTLDIDGDLALSADGGNVTMDDGTTTIFDFNVDSPLLKIMDDADTGDYCSIGVGTNGATTITTVDDALGFGGGADADLTLDIDGDITLDAATGNVYVKDNGGNYTPGSDYEIATKKYVDDNTGASTLNDLSDISYSSGDLTITSLDKIVSGAITFDSSGAIILDSATGGFEMHGAGTTAKFADTYAGMILGYRDIGLNETEASYDLTTSYIVPTSEFGVTFIAPPSGNVEIYMQVGVDNGGSGSGDFFAGLSTIAEGFGGSPSYNALASYHEVELMDIGTRNGYVIINHSWTLTGLTAGTSYTYYAGFKSSSTTGTPHIQWGGNATGSSPDFIMKAIALPATILT